MQTVAFEAFAANHATRLCGAVALNYRTLPHFLGVGASTLGQPIAATKDEFHFWDAACLTRSVREADEPCGIGKQDVVPIFADAAKRLAGRHFARNGTKDIQVAERCLRHRPCHPESLVKRAENPVAGTDAVVVES